MDTALTPFVLTSAHNLPHLQHLAHFPDAIVMLIDDPLTRQFALLLNHTNQLAFGGGKNMGMPLWVMLDCGILSSAIVGFATPCSQLSAAERARLGVPDDYHGWVPLSEYCACPTLTPGCVSGFSLQCQRPGYGIARRTKAMAMLLYGARTQVGVTQFDNPAIRVHASLGPLRIIIHRPAIHTHADHSFVYHATLPSPDVLCNIARGELSRAPCALPAGERWTFHPGREEHHARLARLLGASYTVWITPPAWHRDPEGVVHLDLCIEPPSTTQ